MTPARTTATEAGAASALDGNHRLPLPAPRLMARVGAVRAEEEYLALGERLAHGLLDALPSDWTFEGKDVLDFGSGAGRVLRQLFEPLSSARSVVAADRDAASIDWLSRHLSPPFSAVQVEREPPTPFADDSFDLIYAVSVFTHLGVLWWPWLRELRRISRPGAYVLLSFHERRPYEARFGEPFPEDDVGMVVVSDSPDDWREEEQVFHSEWWIREMWGHVFTVERIFPDQLDGWQHLAVLRTPSGPTPGDADRPPRLDVEREMRLLEANVHAMRLEGVRIRRAYGEIEQEIHRIYRTWSWRVTTPMRALRRRMPRREA